MAIFPVIHLDQRPVPVSEGALDAQIVVSRLFSAQTTVAKLSENRFEVRELVIPAQASANGPTGPEPER